MYIEILNLYINTHFSNYFHTSLSPIIVEWLLRLDITYWNQSGFVSFQDTENISHSFFKRSHSQENFQLYLQIASSEVNTTQSELNTIYSNIVTKEKDDYDLFMKKNVNISKLEKILHIILNNSESDRCTSYKQSLSYCHFYTW